MGFVEWLTARPRLSAVVIVVALGFGVASLPSHKDRPFRGSVPYLKR